MRAVDPYLPARRGLTLIELVVAMAVAGIVMAAGYGIFLVQQKTYAVQDQVAEIQQNARVAMNVLARDLRMAGHGVPKLWTVDIGQPRTYAVTVSGSTMTLLGCFGAPEGYLSESAGIGDTTIFLFDDFEPSDFDKQDGRQYVFIGGYDKAVITDTDLPTRTLTIDTDPAAAGDHGLKKRYPTTRLTADANQGDKRIAVATTTGIQIGDLLNLGDEKLYVTGTTPNTIDFDTDPTTPFNDPLQNEYKSGSLVNPIPVYRVKALQYAFDGNGKITRQDLSGGGRVALAENIQSLTITPEVPNNPTYEIVLTARTEVPDYAGIYRSRTFRFTVTCRNF